MSARTIDQTQVLLQTLRGALYAVPHLRLGQLLGNLVESPTELYYLDDVALTQRLVAYIAEHTRAPA